MRRAEGRNEGFGNEQQNRQQQGRRQNLADAVDQFLRRYGQPERNDEEQDQEARHDHVTATALQERTDGDFIRYTACTRDSEERSDCQITDDGKKETVCRMDAASQFLQVLTA